MQDDARIEQRGEALQIVGQNVVKQVIPMVMIDALVILGRAQVTTQVLQLCMRYSVPVHYATRNGRLLGTCFPCSNGMLGRRLRQYTAHQDEARRLAIAKSFVQGKMRRQMETVQRYRKRVHGVSSQEQYFAKQQIKVLEAQSFDELLGLEGETTKRYFSNFPDFLRNIKWKGRNRQPPKDPVNALLSLSYMLVLSDISTVCMSMGFEVGIGFLHTIQSQRPSLACDFLELYRPRIDQFVIRLFNREEITEDDFEKDGEGVLLKRKRFGSFMEKYDAFRPNWQTTAEMLNVLNRALKEEGVPCFAE